MAQQLYEEKKIRAIATKIRSLAPILGNSTFTTAEMPDAIERVYEEGKRKGKTEGYGSGYNEGVIRGKEDGYNDGYNKGHDEGYHKGYTEGAEDNQGVNLPPLTSPGTADDLVEGKQLIDGNGNIVYGAIPVRTATDLDFEQLAQHDLGLTVPLGYYGEGVTKIIDVKPYYEEGYEVGEHEGFDRGRQYGWGEGYQAGLAANTYEDGNGVAY